jgi:hypothetical protein
MKEKSVTFFADINIGDMGDDMNERTKILLSVGVSARPCRRDV